MPLISEFNGLKIYMYYNDHYPPHFHVRGGGYAALMAINGGDIIEGNLPSNLIKLVKRWLIMHTSELMDNWDRAQKGQSLFKIAPCD